MSSHAPRLPTEADIQKLPLFSGGSRWLVAGGGVGLVLLLATLVAAFAGDQATAKEAYYSYLIAFTYWCGLAFASTILLMCFHATRARWVTVLRRPLEVMASTMPLFLVLLIPVLLGMNDLYEWINPPASLGPEAVEKILHKRAWLNTNFFVVRGFIYIAIASFVSERLFRMSLRSDTGKDDNWSLLARMRRLASGGLPFVGLAMTFAAFDWLMSLNPTWYSTIFGVYYFAGSFGAALSICSAAFLLAAVFWIWIPETKGRALQ